VTPLLLGGALLLMGSSNAAAGMNAGAKSYPNVPLINQDGETLRFYDDVIKGKVVTINFMFTSCVDSCPLETAKLLEVQKRLGEHVGKNVYMYSISVDPDRDTPQALKAYMKKFKVGPGWQFLTGKQEDIDLIRKKLGMYVEGENELSDHSISFVIGNEATGRWVKRSPFDVPEALVTVLLGRMQTRSLLSTVKRPDYASVPKKAASIPGEDLFITRCTICHSIGKGRKVGPDLLGVVGSLDLKWLIRWLMEPDVVLKEKDPLATALFEQYNRVSMPNLRLSEQDAIDLIYFLQVESKRAMEEKTVSNVPQHDHSAHQHSAPVEPEPKLDDHGDHQQHQ
jgi:protein SCO1/2